LDVEIADGGITWCKNFMKPTNWITFGVNLYRYYMTVCVTGKTPIK
jgi:hypothetical protein